MCTPHTLQHWILCLPTYSPHTHSQPLPTHNQPASRQIEAAAVKEEGNRAFAAKRYAEAVDHFTRAIELDPKCGPALLTPLAC